MEAVAPEYTLLVSDSGRCVDLQSDIRGNVFRET